MPAPQGHQVEIRSCRPAEAVEGLLALPSSKPVFLSKYILSFV